MHGVWSDGLEELVPVLSKFQVHGQDQDTLRLQTPFPGKFIYFLEKSILLGRFNLLVTFFKFSEFYLFKKIERKIFF